jgi:transcription elongation factor GreA
MFQVSDPRQSSQRATSDSLPLTASAYRNVEEELARLRAERRDHVERLSAALDFGEAGANDEVAAIREDEGITQARIARLQDILARAEVVDSAPDSDVVAIGSVVTVLDHASGSTNSYIVDGVHGSRDSNVISALSPMGLALIGKEAGDVVSVELPRGRVRTLTVLDVAVAQGT